MRTEINARPNGARFFRADLHIHSYGASHDVSDATCTPERIVATARKEGLHVIAIADHNEISNISKAVAASKSHRIMLVPAVELSTQQGHLLCYLPTEEALQRFFAALTIRDRGKGTCHCTQSMTDCLDLLRDHHGFGVLAHVDGGNGFDRNNPTTTPFKRSVICHPALLGLELTTITCPVSYSDKDKDSARKALGRERLTAIGGAQQALALVLNSDSHTLDRVGKNAASLARVTRFKMNDLTFEGLRLAMMENDARVRIEEEIPATVPQIVGVKMTGGFLDGQTVRFSSNLNCIIGGRGTGKSTLFELIRTLAAYGEEPADVVDSEVGPDQVDMLVQDETGQTHGISRIKADRLQNADNITADPILFPIECYYQGETHEIARRAKEDPAALLEYLDGFVEVADDLEQERKACETAAEQHARIVDLQTRMARIDHLDRELKVVQGQVAAVKTENGQEVLATLRTIARERTIRDDILEKASSITKGTSREDLKETAEAIKAAVDPKTLAVGGTEFGAITTLATEFEKVLASNDASLKKGAEALKVGVEKRLKDWSDKATKLNGTVQKQVKALEDKGIKVQTAFFNQLTTKEESLKKQLAGLRALKPQLEKVQREHKETLKARWQQRQRIANKRNGFAILANDAMKNALNDFTVTLKYEVGGYSPEAERVIIDVMGWNTNQQVRAKALTEAMTVEKLLTVIAKKDAAALRALMNAEGKPVFGKAEIDALLERLALPQTRSKLETCELIDLPRLTVTRMVPDGTGKRAVVREFKNLSFGQQQSVLLALMLSSKSNRPLVIDQPEDDLDGEFIYHGIVCRCCARPRSAGRSSSSRTTPTSQSSVTPSRSLS
jgi:t-SNARE complex subunit (syntaxin)